MKTLSYGDEIENAEVGTSNLELLISDDKLSANSVNRILQNLYEDNEYNYTLIQNLIKNLYGREDGILPNILEEFKEVRILESGTGESYFRVPFGAINLMQPHYKDAGMSHGLSYSGEEENGEHELISDVSDTINNFYSLLGIKKDETTGKLIDTGNGSWRCFNNIKFDEYYNYKTSSWEAKEAVIAKVINDTSGLIYKDYINIDTNNNICGKARYLTEKKIINTEFIDDGFDTYTIFNKPKLSIAKRQIADYINLDIADLDNNIKIYAKKFDNANQLKKSFVHRVANSSEGRAEIETFGVDGGTNADGTTNALNKLDQLSFPFVGYYASITENTVGAVDSSIYKANTETVNFPNIGRDTTWVIIFKGSNGFTSGSDGEDNYPLKFSFFEYNPENPDETEIDRNLYLPAIETFVNTNNPSKEEQINSIVSDINVSYKDYYFAEKINTEIVVNGVATSYPALSITSKINYQDLTNKVRIAITTNNDNYTPNTIVAVKRINSEGKEEDTGYYYSPGLSDFYTTTEKSIAQDYYYDSISLLTGIFGRYSSYVVNESLSKKEFALEEIVDFQIPSTINYGNADISTDEFKYFIYLNSDIDKKYDNNSSRLDKYVSTSKMFGSVLCSSVDQAFIDTDIYKYVIGKEHRDKPIALFEIYVKFDKSSGRNMPFITESKSLFSVLDPNKINTRAAGLNNLLVDTNTKIKNQFYYSDEGIKDYTQTEDGEGFGIKWKANGEKHVNADAGNGGENGNIPETRAIKACVSEGRDNLSLISDSNYKEAFRAGVDDTIETFAPYIYNHSQDNKTKEVIANTYGKRIKLLEGRKLRIEQQETSSNYNDLNLFEVTKNGFLFQRNENWNGTEKQKNYLCLKNVENQNGYDITATSEMKSRDSGILISSENYIDSVSVDDTIYNVTPNDKENYFKLYANNNKTWIKGISGKLTIAANKNEGTSPDIILENNPINYFDFSALYGNIGEDGSITEDSNKSGVVYDNRGKTFTKSSNNEKGNKYLRIKGNFIIGNDVENNTETRLSTKTPYVAIFNADTFLKGKFNVATSNKDDGKGNPTFVDCSSFTIEKDKIFASNYNDFWINGNYKNEKEIKEGRYSLRLRNKEGLEFRKIKEGCASTADLNVASSIILNDNHVYASFKDVNTGNRNNAVRHFLELSKDTFHVNIDSDFDALYKIDNRVENYEQNIFTKENIFTLKTSNTYGSVILKTRTSDKETKLFTNVKEQILDADTVYIGRFTDGSEGATTNYAYNAFDVNGGFKNGNLVVKGMTTMGPKNTSKERNTLQVYGATFIGAKSGNGYNSEGIAVDGNGDVLDYSLYVGGKTTARGNLSVEGDMGINGNLNVDQGTNVKGTLNVEKNAIIKKDLIVNDNYNLGTQFNTKSGSTTVEKDVTIEGALTVNGDTSIDKTLSIKQFAQFNTSSGSTDVTKKVGINANLLVNGNTTIGNSETKDGLLKIFKTANFNTNGGATDITTVGGFVSVSEKFMVNGTAVIGGGKDENGVLLVGKPLTNETSIEVGEALVQRADIASVTYIEKGKVMIKSQRSGAASADTTIIEGGAIACTYVQTTSSRTKKKNIVHSERNAVKAINDIEIVDFFYKNDKDEKNQKVGFIAEDTDSIFSTNKKDCMDHSNCIGMLLKAVQELSAEIEELKKNR